jgi:hypothetical protein
MTTNLTVNNAQFKEYNTLLVTDLVDRGVIGNGGSGGSWNLGTDFAGMTAGTVFRSREELIERVVTALIGTYASRAGIVRAA